VKGEKKELWSQSYTDDWPPHEAYIADDGQHVVLRDRHYSLGFGKVLVFLGPKGEILKSYELEDLLTQDQILITPHSVSSIWWSSPGWFSFLKDQQQFAFVTYHGAMDCFDVATGERAKLDEKKQEEIRDLALKEFMPLLKNDNYSFSTRQSAVTMCGVLKAQEVVPELKKLLANPRNGLQSSAAEALASILGIQAVPLIEKQLADSKSTDPEGLLKAIANLDSEMDEVIPTPDSAVLLETWKRLSESPIAKVREFAVLARLLRDEAQYIYDHPELMKDADWGIRFYAVRCLIERGDKRAIPLLRDAFHDRDSTVRWWAYRGLIQYKPEDLKTLLMQGLKHEDDIIRSDAIKGLAREGDKDAIAQVVDILAKLKDHEHDAKNKAYDRGAVILFEGWLQLVVELKLTAAEPVLREIYATDCEEVRRPVSAALAALGDQKALEDLRQFMRKGDALDRWSSIEMIALVGDVESLPYLQETLNDRSPMVRKAAKKAIVHLEQKAKETPHNPDNKK
jgi:HEAT repeat protein